MAIRSSSNESSDDDPQLLASRADHVYWLNNLSKAAPLYRRAEKLFADKGDARDEIYAKVGVCDRKPRRCHSITFLARRSWDASYAPHRAIS